MKPRNNTFSQGLCWFCVNSVPSADGTRGCCWSRELKPVEGWTAEEQTHICVCRKDPGYKVFECPEFVEDTSFESLDEPICQQKGRKKQ